MAALRSTGVRTAGRSVAKPLQRAACSRRRSRRNVREHHGEHHARTAPRADRTTRGRAAAVPSQPGAEMAPIEKRDRRARGLERPELPPTVCRVKRRSAALLAGVSPGRVGRRAGGSQARGAGRRARVYTGAGYTQARRVWMSDPDTLRPRPVDALLAGHAPAATARLYCLVIGRPRGAAPAASCARVDRVAGLARRSERLRVGSSLRAREWWRGIRGANLRRRCGAPRRRQSRSARARRAICVARPSRWRATKLTSGRALLGRTRTCTLSHFPSWHGRAGWPRY